MPSLPPPHLYLQGAYSYRHCTDKGHMKRKYCIIAYSRILVSIRPPLDTDAEAAGGA